MSQVIQVTNLSKAYQLGQFSTGTLTQDLKRWWALTRGKEDPFLKIGETNDRSVKGSSNVVWSLRDINFEIKQGDAVGIIGKNGAGKSTLLKILSQITSPTTGQMKVKGRIASLLEVGTGFHPELTGRENIFLNGAILGMRKAEIVRKFDEIVAFSGIEKYIDTPVKRYSSGMYVRLAFAVAAHLESEILIVDEVLAVGDSEFQKKCLGKMNDVSKGEGRTVLFVSHNIRSINELCNHGILLEKGKIISLGEIKNVIDCYENINRNLISIFTPFEIPELKLRVSNIELIPENNIAIIPGERLIIKFQIYAKEDIENIGIELFFTHDDTTGLVFATNTKTRKNINVKLKKGNNIIFCNIENLNLCSGVYKLGFGIDKPFVSFYYYEKEILVFEIQETQFKNSYVNTSSAYGHVYLNHNWIIK
jgi:lipopolysaccharide transport system ATP-binding protein